MRYMAMPFALYPCTIFMWSRHVFSELVQIYLIWLSNCPVFGVLKEESVTDLIFLNLELVASCFVVVVVVLRERERERERRVCHL